MSESPVLRPAEFAQRLGVRTRVVIEAMYERRVPRVRLDAGTLGIPEDALENLRAPRNVKILRHLVLHTERAEESGSSRTTRCW